MISLLLPVSAFGLLLQPPALGAPRGAFRQSVPRMVATGEPSSSKVTREETTYQLAFVNSPKKINTGPVTYEDVKAWKLTNDVGISVTVMRKGACAVEVMKDGKNYLWCYTVLTTPTRHARADLALCAAPEPLTRLTPAPLAGRTKKPIRTSLRPGRATTVRTPTTSR